MANVYKARIDIKNVKPNFKPVFVQFDHAALEIELTDNGRVYNLTNAERVEFTHVRKDGLVIIQPGEIVTSRNGKVIRYEYLGSEMEFTGTIQTSFAVFDANNKKVSTHSFNVTIVKDLRDDVFEPAEPNYGLLQTLINDVEFIKENGGSGGVGSKGEKGDKGDVGPIGPQGPQGLQGVQGSKGEPGIQGATGPQGLKGDKGDTGLQGIQGVPGTPGTKGDAGPKGDPFTYSNFTQSQLEALRGPKGDVGLQGATGSKGDKGDTGSQGIQGVTGPKGDTGPQGAKGDKGDPGIQGPKGESGDSGSGSGLVTVKNFGAVGDGVTDDATAINNAVNTLSTQGGGVLRFDGSTYAIGSPIIMKSNVTLMGEPYKTTLLTITNTIDVFNYSESANNTEINGFIIKSSQGISESARNSGFYYGRYIIMQSILKNLVIDGFYNGIDARNFWKSSLVENVHFKKCRTNINVQQSVNGDVSSVTLLNVLFEDPTHSHLNLQFAEGLTFIGCRFQGDGTTGYSVNLTSCCIKFDNCRFDGMDSTLSDIAIITISQNSIVGFENCYMIDQKSTGTNTAIFEALTGSRMSLNNFAFETSTGFTNTFRVDATSRITYSNCARMEGMSANSVAVGGFLIDMDNVLTNMASN